MDYKTQLKQIREELIKLRTEKMLASPKSDITGINKQIQSLEMQYRSILAVSKGYTPKNNIQKR